MDHDNEGEKMEKRFSLLLQVTVYCFLKSLFIISEVNVCYSDLFSSAALFEGYLLS